MIRRNCTSVIANKRIDYLKSLIVKMKTYPFKATYALVEIQGIKIQSIRI